MADIEMREASPTAFYIKVHDTDNVAIIVNDNGLKAGTRFPDGLTLIEHIPQGQRSHWSIFLPMGRSCVTVKSSAMPFAQFRREAGLMSRWLSCQKRHR